MRGVCRALAGRLVVMCMTFGAMLLIAPAAFAVQLHSNEIVSPSLSSPAQPGDDIQLSSGQLRETVAQLRAGKQPPSGVRVRNGRVDVEILTDLPQADARSLVEDAGGQVLGSVPGELVQALIPFGKLESLERRSGVESIRTPVRVNARVDIPQAVAPGAAVTGASTPIVGEEVAKTNASGWQAATWTGADVKIGIVDFFQQTAWDDAATAGELPVAPAGSFCQYNGGACNVFTSFVGDATLHGEGVAEIIHEQAPDAKLYLATVNTVSDLQAAVTYFTGQGVKIVSRSLGSALDGPGDGTGPVDTVVNSAIAGGMSWFNAAGNNAGPSHNGGTLGSYWRGSWSDPNSNGFLNWAAGDEFGAVICGSFVNGFRWNDWGPAANRTNYDVFIYDTTASYPTADGELHRQPADGREPDRDTAIHLQQRRPCRLHGCQAHRCRRRHRGRRARIHAERARHRVLEQPVQRDAARRGLRERRRTRRSARSTRRTAPRSAPTAHGDRRTTIARSPS